MKQIGPDICDLWARCDCSGVTHQACDASVPSGHPPFPAFKCPSHPPRPCACAHQAPGVAPPPHQPESPPARGPGRACHSFSAHHRSAARRARLGNSLPRLCTRQTRLKLVLSPPLVGIHKAARLNRQRAEVHVDCKRPRTGQWLHFCPNPEVCLDSASRNYNSQKPRRCGR